MNKRKTINYSLNWVKTLPYFFDHIKGGKTLSQKVCKKIDFMKGSFFTTLSDDAFLERLFNFKQGIMLSKPYGDKTYTVKDGSKLFVPTHVVTMDRECCEFIADFLHASEHNWAVVDDYNQDPLGPHVNRENVKMCPYDSDVHYFLNKKNSLKEIYYNIKQSNPLWHSLIILTQLKEGVPDVLTEENLDQICENAQFVIVSAYDGEGYIFWPSVDGIQYLQDMEIEMIQREEIPALNLDHLPPIKPHWDYRNADGEQTRLFLDGTWEYLISS